MGIIYFFLLCVLVTNFFLQGTKAANCPKNWRRYNDQCIAIFKDPLVWAEAEATCVTRGAGGHLVSFNSEAELDFIISLIKFNFPDVKGVWTGLEDARGTKQWRWSDSNPFNFRPWNNDNDDEDKDDTTEASCAFLLGEKDFQKLQSGCCRQKMAYACKSVL